ncbi:hypothetical protein ACFE04_016331 [Oxalis oulophora]
MARNKRTAVVMGSWREASAVRRRAGEEEKSRGIMEERVEIDELSLGQLMEDYSLYGDMHAKTDTFLTNVLKKWKGEEFFIHEVNGDRLYKLLDTMTWVDD